MPVSTQRTLTIFCRVVASFGDKERYMGDAASPHMRSNYRNTLLSVKRLIGKKFSDPDVQSEIENFLLFDCVQLDNDEIGMKVCESFSC